MEQRMEKILKLIEEFNEDYSTYRQNYNPNESRGIFSGKIEGYFGNGCPNDNPEDDQFEISF